MHAINPTRMLGTLAAAGILFLASGGTALHAANRWWDGGAVNIGANGDGVSGGTAGTWDTTILNWDQGAALPHVAWNNAANDTAILGGTAGTVTLGANISVGGLTFSTSAYNITTGANSLSFAATNNPILFNNVAAATISGTVGGSGNLILSSSNPATAGTLTFNGASAGGWSGTTTVNAGMTLAATSNTPASTQNLVLKNTSGITLNGGAITVNRLWVGPASENYISDSAPVTVNSGGTLNISSLTAGNLLLNETIHSVTVNSGQFFLSPGNGSSGSHVTVANGITLNGTAAIGFFSNTTVTGTNTVTVAGAGTTSGWVNGASSNPIIGPWATVGTTAALQTDYAVYNSNVITPANTAGSVETTWTSAARSYTNNSAAQTLTGTRTISALRNTGATATLTLASGANLETYGLLNGVNTLFTVAPGTGGVLTTPAGGGNLLINTGSGAITVSAPINDNGGAVTLVKNGSNTLTLSAAANNYTGGTVLNAGTLATTADANLGAGGGIIVNGAATWNAGLAVPVTYNRSLTVNEGAVLSLASGNAGKTITGVLSGNGAIVNTSTTGFDFSNTGNTFTGTVNSGYTTSFASLGDSSNPINLAGSLSQFSWTGGAKTFALRPFTLNNTFAGAGNNSSKIGNNGSGALTIQQDLAISGPAGARTLELNGSNTGPNVFAGNIADGVNGGASVVSLTKSGAGTWALSGANTYTGATTMGFSNPGNGNLVFQGMQALSPNTLLTQTHSGGVGQHGTFKLLDDSATPASRSTVNLTFNHSNNSMNSFSVFVGNNSVANGGTSSSTQTGSTIQVGNMNFNQTSNLQLAGTQLTATGANGYKLQIGNVNVSLNGGFAAAWPVRLNASSADIIVGGNVQQLAGATSANVALQLDGANTGNQILGNVLDSADGVPRALNLTKLGTGAWTLSGANTYTGLTTVTGGRLNINGNSSGATGAVGVSAGALGGTGTVGGAVTLSGTGGIDLRNGAVANLTLGSTLNITGAAGANNLYFDLGNGTGTSDQISVGGATTVTSAGAAVINVNQLGGFAGRTATTYTLIGGAGTLAAADFAKFTLATTTGFGQTYSLTNTGNDLQLVATNVTSVTPAAFWAGGGNNWSTPGNWRSTVAGNGAVAGAPDYQTNVTFATTTPVAANLATNVLDVDFDINSLNFNTGGVTIGGGSRTLTIEATSANGNTAGSGINAANSSGANIISAKILLAAPQTWTQAAGGTLDIRGGVNNGGNTLTFGGNGNFAFDASGSATVVISGAGGIVKNGTGNLILSAGGTSPLHNFTGGVTLNGGAIKFQSSAFFANGNTLITDGYLAGRFNSGYTWSGLGTGQNQIQITGGTSGFSGEGTTGSTFQIGAAGSTLTWGSAFFNPSVLVVGGAGGNTNGVGSLNNGIDLNGATRTMTSTLLTNNAPTSGFTISGVISNSSGAPAGLTKTGVGNLILASANTFNGVTTLSAGYLTLGNANALQNSAFDATSSIAGSGTAGLRTTATTLTLGGLIGNKDFAATGGVFTTATGGYGAVTALTLNPAASDNHSYSGVIANGAPNMTLTKTGAGTQTLSGANTYTGATTISGGTLQLGAGGATGALSTSSAISVGSGATFAVNQTDTVAQGTDFSGAAITGAGGFAQSGTGTTILTAANNFAGGTTVNAGTLKVNNTTGSGTGTGNVTINSGAKLKGTGTISGALLGAGLVGPGNSPGILTVGQVNTSAGMDFAFEITATGAPNWNAPAASVNGVLRITNATPFVGGNMTAANVVDVYLQVPNVLNGDSFQGGFFTDANANFLSTVNNAAYNFYVQGDGAGAVLYEGNNYYSLLDFATLANANIALSVSVQQVPTANFPGGDVQNGWVTRFNVSRTSNAIVPEPASIAIWSLVGLALTGYRIRRTRRSQRKLPACPIA